MMQPRSSSWMRRDQATRLRELTLRQEDMGLLLAVTSGKGGVGKTSIAVNLSISLAARGFRVILVDVDLGLANADLLLNVQAQHTLQHVVSGVRALDEICIEGPGGIRFIPGSSGVNELANLSEFERQTLISHLHKLKINTDMVVLDCGAGISNNTISFALAADRVLVVTTPQPTAMTDAYATIKTLHRAECLGSVGLLVNMARHRQEAAATYTRISEVAKRFLDYSVADGGFLVHDTVVEQAVLARCPFVLRFPASKASACMTAISQGLVRDRLPREARTGFLRRVAGLFA